MCEHIKVVKTMGIEYDRPGFDSQPATHYLYDLEQMLESFSAPPKSWEEYMKHFMESIYMKHLMESTYHALDWVSTQSVSASTTKVIVAAQVTAPPPKKNKTHKHREANPQAQVSALCQAHETLCSKAFKPLLRPNNGYHPQQPDILSFQSAFVSQVPLANGQ